MSLSMRPTHTLFDLATQWSTAMSLPSKYQTEDQTINCMTTIGFVPASQLTEENIEDKVASIRALVAEGLHEKGWEVDLESVVIKLEYQRHGTLSISASVTRPGSVETGAVLGWA